FHSTRIDHLLWIRNGRSTWGASKLSERPSLLCPHCVASTKQHHQAREATAEKNILFFVQPASPTHRSTKTSTIFTAIKDQMFFSCSKSMFSPNSKIITPQTDQTKKQLML
ncbi:unnamed protein product, partial [Ectocarpus sp. 4 AP-2014]